MTFNHDTSVQSKFDEIFIAYMDIQEFSDDLEIIESTTSSAMAELFKRHLPDHDFTITVELIHIEKKEKQLDAFRWHYLLISYYSDDDIIYLELLRRESILQEQKNKLLQMLTTTTTTQKNQYDKC